MGDQIAFPYNYESYVNKGMAALQAGNNAAAADFFEKALSIRQSEDVLLFYLMIIQESGREKAALAFLAEHALWLWESRSLLDVDRLFLELLIQTGEIEDAQSQYERRERHLPNHSQMEVLNQLAHRLQKRRERERVDEEQLRKRLLEERQMVLGGEFLATNAFLRHCQQLTTPSYLEVCIPLLEDERVHALHKTEILQNLKERAVTEACTVTKGAYSRKLSPVSLLAVHEVPFYQRGEQLLANKENVPEESTEAITRNLFLHTAYYYPFEEDALLSADQWLEGILYLQSQGKHSAAVPSQQVMAKIREVERAMNELAGF